MCWWDVKPYSVTQPLQSQQPLLYHNADGSTVEAPLPVLKKSQYYQMLFLHGGDSKIRSYASSYPRQLCRYRIFESVCLFICLFVQRELSEMTRKCSNLVYLGISCKWYGYGLKGQRSTLGLTAIRRGFQLSECLLVLSVYE